MPYWYVFREISPRESVYIHKLLRNVVRKKKFLHVGWWKPKKKFYYWNICTKYENILNCCAELQQISFCISCYGSDQKMAIDWFFDVFTRQITELYWKFISLFCRRFYFCIILRYRSFVNISRCKSVHFDEYHPRRGWFFFELTIGIQEQSIRFNECLFFPTSQHSNRFQFAQTVDSTTNVRYPLCFCKCFPIQFSNCVSTACNQREGSKRDVV